MTLAAVLALAAVHLFAGKLQLVRPGPRSKWLSAAGGASVAYVFIHLLPELARAQETLEEIAGLEFLERHVYLLALVGLALFYGLEKAAHTSRGSNGEGSRDKAAREVFLLHVSVFFMYNAIVGYLLLNPQRGPASTALFALALGLHFLVNDYALRQHHEDDYHSVGRFVLAGGVLAGWALGMVTRIPETAVAGLLAFLAGGVILNVLKEEVPAQNAARFWPFVGGLAAYSLLLFFT